MSKKKLNTSATKADGKQIYFVGKMGIKIYPIQRNGKMFIQIDNNGKIKTFEKELTQKDVNDALAKTIIYYYELLKNKK